MSSENIQRTVCASYLQTCLLLAGMQFVPLPHSTLNERFGVQNGIVPPAGVNPQANYWMIGIGGGAFSQGINGQPIPTPQGHEADDLCLFQPVPFVMRALTNDLTTAQQAGYRMRVVVTLGGIQYAQYFMRTLPLAGVVPSANLTTIVNGVSNTTPFIPTTANLNPTPQTLSNSGVNTTTGNYISASAPVTLTMSTFDVQEFQNACTLLYGSANYATITEIAIISGVDKAVASPGVGSATINVTEVICAQVLAFVETFIALSFMNSGVQYALNIGASEPLFQLSSV